MGLSVRPGALNFVHGNGDIGPPRHPKNDEFRRLMRSTSLSQSDLADRIDAHVNTVSGWATDKHEPPGSVLAYLRLLEKVLALGE